MIQTIVTADDVEAELGHTFETSLEKVRVERWITSCLALISSTLKCELSDLDPAALKIVVPQVVARKVLNPEGKTSERIDDYYYTREVQKYGLALTQEEWEIVTPHDVREDMGAFTISPFYTAGWRAGTCC